MMNKLSIGGFAVLALAFSASVVAGEEKVASDETKLAQNLNAPTPAYSTDVRPGEQSGSTMVLTPIAVPASAVAPLPASLAGRWNSPDGKYSQKWQLDDINPVAKTATLTWYSTKWGNCNINGMPVAVQYDGTTLKVSAADKTFKWLHCSTFLTAELTKTGSAWVGKVYSDSFSVGIPYAETTMQ